MWQANFAAFLLALGSVRLGVGLSQLLRGPETHPGDPIVFDTSMIQQGETTLRQDSW